MRFDKLSCFWLLNALDFCCKRRLSLGSSVGVCEGVNDGAAVGALVGTAEGAVVGTFEGRSVVGA